MKYLFFIKIQCVSLYMVYEIVYLNFQVIFLTENTIFDRSSGQNCSQPIRLDSSIGSFGSLLTPSSSFFSSFFHPIFEYLQQSFYIFLLFEEYTVTFIFDFIFFQIYFPTDSLSFFFISFKYNFFIISIFFF